MRRVIDAVFLSLDGVMQAPGGPDEDPTGGFAYGGWWAPYFDEVVGGVIGEAFERPFDLLLGRRTYEIFAAHWPYVEGADEVARPFATATKYVARRSAEQPLDWGPAERLTDAAHDVARLKQSDGPPLLIQGSGDLVHTLLAQDLIDELVLLVAPVVLGKGKRFFDAGAAPAAFSLLETKASTTGVVISRYVRAGAVRTGSFPVPEPTPAAELARRERWKQEG